MTDDQETPERDADDTARIDEEMILATNAGESSSNPHVETLSREIGPRPPGSEQEGAAADYLVDALQAVGLPAARLKSTAPRHDTLPEMAFAFAALLAIMVAAVVPALGLLLLVAVLGATLANLYGYLKLSSVMTGIDTVNVLSIVPPADTEVRRLIVTATLDTGKVGVLSRRHLAHWYAWLHTVIPGTVVVALLITVVALFDTGNALRLLLLAPALVAIAVLALLVERQQGTTSSPGAISNASGVAAMIDIARSTVQSPARWLEVWFLGVGASTLRGGGMTDFLRKNTFDPDTTYFVHLQSLGGGRPSVPKSVGAGLRTAPATPLLTWIFDSVKPDLNDPNTPQLQRLHVESLANATHRAGYQSVVLAGVDEQGRIPFLDNPEDLPYQVNDDSIKESARLVALAIDALDREVASRAMLARSTASVQAPLEHDDLPKGLPTDAG